MNKGKMEGRRTLSELGSHPASVEIGEQFKTIISLGEKREGGGDGEIMHVASNLWGSLSPGHRVKSFTLT